MAGKRTQIILPEELVEEIDRLVGRRGRSSFIVGAATAEVRRLRQLKALKKATGAWKDINHPELAEGAAGWISRLRKESHPDRNGVLSLVGQPFQAVIHGSNGASSSMIGQAFQAVISSLQSDDSLERLSH